MQIYCLKLSFGGDKLEERDDAARQGEKTMEQGSAVRRQDVDSQRLQFYPGMEFEGRWILKRDGSGVCIDRGGYTIYPDRFSLRGELPLPDSLYTLRVVSVRGRTVYVDLVGAPIEEGNANLIPNHQQGRWREFTPAERYDGSPRQEFGRHTSREVRREPGLSIIEPVRRNLQSQVPQLRRLIVQQPHRGEAVFLEVTWSNNGDGGISAEVDGNTRLDVKPHPELEWNPDNKFTCRVEVICEKNGTKFVGPADGLVL